MNLFSKIPVLTTRKAPIVVTGIHRSGSTWVGKMLAAASDVYYVHEPFSLNWEPGVCGVRFPRWYTYLHEGNEARYGPALEAIADFTYNPLSDIGRVRNLSQALTLRQRFWGSLLGRTLGHRALIKDPIALPSAEWLYRRLQAEMVVLIRHPAAVAASLKVKNWQFDFRDFSAQPRLIEDHFSAYREDIERLERDKGDVIEQAIVLWNCLYAMVAKFREQQPTWIFLRHEDVSREPLEHFSQLYTRLGLRGFERARATIEEFSAASNPLQEFRTFFNHGKNNTIRRHSRELIFTWKKRLTPEEIRRIRTGTAEVAGRFYGDPDW